ncbi:MAG TPA: hypothetical protein VI542_06465 [Candidatus Tectomicrobia bacterium]
MTTGVSEAQILEELQALREAVSALQAARDMHPRVRLHATPERPFLGQPVTITATVTREHLASIGVPVTFMTHWGRLHVTAGYLTEQGSTVTTRTGLDGSASITLLPPTSEEMWREQQDALETALRALHPEAATPHDTLAGLQEMARQYRWHVHTSLRHAMDMYFRDFGQALRDVVNVRNMLDAWKYIDTTVVAYVPDHDGGVQSSAVLRLRYKDWLGAWLQTYLDIDADASPLQNEFDNVKQRGGSAETLLDMMHTRVRDFLKNQQGLIDTYASRQIAARALRTFLNTGLGDIPAATRYQLTPALESVSTTIAAAGMHALTTLSQVRADLQQAELGAKVQRFETDLSGRVHTAVDAAVGTLVPDRVGSALTAALSTLQTEAGQVRTSALASLQTEVGQLRANTLESLRSEATRLRTDIISGLRTEVGSMHASTLQSLQADALTLRTDALAGLQTDITRLRGNTLSGVQADLTQLRADTLNGLRTEATKLRADTFSGLQTDIGRLRTSTLREFEAEIGRVRRDTVTGLRTDIQGVRLSALEGLQNEAAQLRANTLQTLRTEADRLRIAEVQRLRTEMGNVGRPPR